ncbi:unnamed protein product [Phytomonas sp. Hart1]|nr:unnamed protein product [Phytomonas sp. Hart1]|eukprot:CCW71204.1 unnamed protein product [Phytomonas sp. isolate Hart1]
MGGCSCKSLSQLRKKSPYGKNKGDYGEIYLPTENNKLNISHTQVHVPTETSLNDAPSNSPYYLSPNREGSRNNQNSDLSNSFGTKRSKSNNMHHHNLGNSKHPYHRNITDIYVNPNEDFPFPYNIDNAALSDDASKIEMELILDESSSTDLCSSTMENLASLHSVNVGENKCDTNMSSISFENQDQNLSRVNARGSTKDFRFSVLPSLSRDSFPVERAASLLNTERDSSAFRTPIEDFSSDVSDICSANRPFGYTYYNNNHDPSQSIGHTLPERSKPPLPHPPEKSGCKSKLTVVDVRSNRSYGLHTPETPHTFRRINSLTSACSEPYEQRDRAFFSCRSTATSALAGQTPLTQPSPSFRSCISEISPLAREPPSGAVVRYQGLPRREGGKAVVGVLRSTLSAAPSVLLAQPSLSFRSFISLKPLPRTPPPLSALRRCEVRKGGSCALTQPAAASSGRTLPSIGTGGRGRDTSHWCRKGV